MLCYIYIYIYLYITLTESPAEPNPELWNSDFESDTDDEFHPDEQTTRTMAFIDALSEMFNTSTPTEPLTVPPPNHAPTTATWSMQPTSTTQELPHGPSTLGPSTLLLATGTTPAITQEINPDPTILVTSHTPHNSGCLTSVNCNTTTYHLETLYNPTCGFDFHTPHNSGLNTTVNYTPPTSGTWLLK